MDIKQKAYEVGKDLQLSNLATITNDGKPWVRYVMGNLDQNLIFITSAQLFSRKISQIQKNPKSILLFL